MARLLQASLAGLAGGIVLALFGAAPLPESLAALHWWDAHGWFLVVAFVMPALAHLTVAQASPLVGKPMQGEARLAALYLAAGVVVAVGHLLQPSGVFAWVAFAGMVLFAASGTLQSAAMLGMLPRRGVSVVDVARDPLTKGDDASLKHVKFAHFSLPLGLLLLAIAYWPGLGGGDWATRFRLAGFHLLLLGYATLSIYGLSHIVVPRLCGVPAIAAGAIKGELHSTLLGIVLLTAGFLADVTGLIVAGGAAVFLGTFTFMGVLGANIMRNKSRTQRVTPEFVYVPWTFAGVFWLVSAVLLGIFLTVAARTYPDKAGALRAVHAHAALFGGLVQLFLGYLTRLLPMRAGLPPPSFARLRWSFYALNGSLVLLIAALLTGPDWTMGASAGLATVGLAAWFISLRRYRAAGVP